MNDDNLIIGFVFGVAAYAVLQLSMHVLERIADRIYGRPPRGPQPPGRE